MEWRLLILDGHASHLTKNFIKYSHQKKILLCVFPPHSTHRLHPLDVVMFKPLASAYCQELDAHLQRGQGLVLIRKGDFFPLFWRAWKSSFVEKNILASSGATGIWPMDPEPVIKAFKKQRPTTPPEQTSASVNDWHELERLFRAAVTNRDTAVSKKLSHTLHHFQVQNELVKLENKGLRKALDDKKKHKKKGKVLSLQTDKEYWSGATFYSPRKFNNAQHRQRQMEQEEEEKQLQKATDKQLKEAQKLVKQQQAAERKTEREAKAERSHVVKAEKAAERKRKQQENNSKKPVKRPQLGKRKVSAAPAPKAKRMQQFGDEVTGNRWVEAPSAAQPSVSKRGRTTKPRRIFE
jgi:hypothetical protein